MLALTLVGTNDLARATAFYDALLGELGCVRAAELDRIVLWSPGDGKPLFGVAEPADGNPASVGNGCMLSFAAASPADVDRLHAKALALGATDCGAPGARSNRSLNFYAAYFRDPDGNKLNFFHAG